VIVPEADTITPQNVSARAKLTRTLRITGVRADGYHLIDAEMVTLDLADTLTFAAADVSTLTVAGRFGGDAPADESNLVLKALAVAGRTATVHVDKRIPGGGGLGGGSADAAAVLRWAGIDDLDVAVRLGADVPFCLVGGRARVRGIGELLEPLPHLPLTVTLVVPPLRVSTPAAYAAWDDLGGPTADGPNDLEPAALTVEPRLAWWRDRIGDLAGVTPVLAGSGATWFVEGHHGDGLSALDADGAVVIEVVTVGAG
jgi:4-diphosphocytidyl-2-C-methyl-D-erythritol kinase